MLNHGQDAKLFELNLPCIEIIDEPEEVEQNKEQKMLIDTLFKTMGYEYFRIVNLNKLEEEASIIKS